MTAPISSIPTIEAIEAELSNIWPGWRKNNLGDIGNPSMHPKRLPEPWKRRVKWLLKAHSLHRRIGETGVTLAEEGWMPQLVADPRRPGNWFCHSLPPDRDGTPRAVEEPAKVKGPPQHEGGLVTADKAPSAAQLAVMTGRPLGVVRAALRAMPAGEDPRVWVSGWEQPKAVRDASV